MATKVEPEQNVKKLYRSTTDKKIAGVCGGIGEYLSADPVAIRLLWVVFTIFTGILPGLLTYLFAVLIIPSRTHSETTIQQD
jgi:phage shock protein C